MKVLRKETVGPTTSSITRDENQVATILSQMEHSTNQ
jgi:hypothetical protein